MKFDPDKKEIITEKELSSLDMFVIDFITTLEKFTEYVIVSGYVSIITGRSRATEDIDLLIPSMNSDEFNTMWKGLEDDGFECINTTNPDEALDMLKEHAIRFARPGEGVPNMEIKLISNEIHQYSFKNKIKLSLTKKTLFISPLEMQIAYKLMLGSEKDLEDAKHIYDLFQDNLNEQDLEKLAEKLDAKENLKSIK